MDESEFLPKKGDLVLRDDQAEFFTILDEAKARREQGARLRLIDSGRVSFLELERLALSGADIFTSDRAGRTHADLVVLSEAARSGGGEIAHFHHGPLLAEAAEPALTLDALREAARRGVRLYLSNREEARKGEDLVVLAEASLRGRRRLGYYYHGTAAAVLEELARRGAWIHVSAAPADAESAAVLRDVAAAAAAAGAGLVIHVERVVPASGLEDLLAAGAYLLLRIPPSDYRSPYRVLEEKAARRPPDARASYLYSEFMR